LDDDFNVLEMDWEWVDFSDVDSDAVLGDVYESDSENKEQYLNRIYRGKIYDDHMDDKIVLEMGTLFHYVNSFRKFRRDYVI
jgi:hypothetical protein